MFGGFSFGEGYFGDVPPVYPAVVYVITRPFIRVPDERRVLTIAAEARRVTIPAARRTTAVPKEPQA